MGSRDRSLPSLGPLQASVMEVLWQRDTATVRTVLESLNAAATKPRAYTTVMTAMHHLDGKGMVTRRRDGKVDVYRSRVSRSAYLEARARAGADAVVAQYGDAAYAAMARRIDMRHRAP